MRKLKPRDEPYVAAIVLALFMLGVFVSHAWPRDLTGKYAQSPDHEWVKSLHSPRGAWCCDLADGHTVLDADWQSKDSHYQVRIEGNWIDVPEDAVIGEPNKIGQTIVWMYRVNGEPVVTCFLPGSGS